MKPFRVRARRGVLVQRPGQRGGMAEYIGRTIAHELFRKTEKRFDGVAYHDAPTELDTEKLYPISAEPTEITSTIFGLHGYHELARSVRHGDLVVADAESARALGVPYHPEPATKMAEANEA